MNVWAVYIGLAVIIVTHLSMLKDVMPQAMQTYHAFGNLAAAFLIIYGVFYSPTPKLK